MNEPGDIAALPGWVSVGDAAMMLNVSDQCVRRWIFDGKFQSAHRVGTRRPVYVLDPVELRAWLSSDNPNLRWRVPAPRPQRRLRPPTSQSCIELLPETQFHLITIEVGDGGLPRVGASAFRPVTASALLGDSYIDEYGDGPCITWEWATDALPGHANTGPPPPAWPVRYAEVDVECVVLGGPRGRAAFRPDSVGLAEQWAALVRASHSQAGSSL